MLVLIFSLNANAADVCKDTVDRKQVPYEFIKKIAPDLDIKPSAGSVFVDLGRYYSHNGDQECISGINVISERSGNSYVLKFEVDTGIPVNKSIETAILACLNKGAAADDSNIITDKAVKKNVQPKYSALVSEVLSSGGNTSWQQSDSRVIIDNPYAETVGFRKEEAEGKLSSESYPNPNKCNYYVSPKPNQLMMANKTENYNIYEETAKLCENHNGRYSDVRNLINIIAEKDTANLQDLRSVARNLQAKIIKDGINDLSKKLEKIESKFDHDFDGDGDFGMSKKKAKQYIKDYAELMDQFSDEILPSIVSQLKEYEILRQEALDADPVDEDYIERLDEKVEELNELTALMDRDEEAENFAYLVDAMAYFNRQKEGKKVLKGIAQGRYYSRVFFDEESARLDDPISIEDAEEEVKDSKEFYADSFHQWGEEAKLRTGKGYGIIQQREYVKKRLEVNRDNSLKKNWELYKKYYKAYCNGFNVQQRCAAVLPRLNSYFTSRASQINRDYQGQMNTQTNLINRYKKIYKTARANIEQEKASKDRRRGNKRGSRGSSRSGGFDTFSSYGNSFYLDGDDGGDFSLDMNSDSFKLGPSIPLSTNGLNYNNNQFFNQQYSPLNIR